MGLVESPTLAPGSIDKLMQYHWPGNVRELQNAVERALILHRGNALSFDDLGETAKNMVPGTPLPGDGGGDSLDQAYHGTSDRPWKRRAAALAEKKARQNC